MPHCFRNSWWQATLLGAVALVAGGCGSGRYPVTGKVLYEDGAPLEEGTVIAEMESGDERVMSQGDLSAGGVFKWGTARPGDGAKPGKYRVAVLPRALGDSELSQGLRPAVDDKFTSFDTSGLEFEVKSSGKNELIITVTKPR